jgi:prepilin-type N-terminal cleavage/methylation domain-containing protein
MPSGDRESRQATGFSLVELLVVIGVVAVLLGFLMPALGRARSQARIVHCMSNLRQVGVAMDAYVVANDGVYPLHYNWGDLMGKHGTNSYYERPGAVTGFAGEPGVTAVRPLNPYLATPDVLHCPNDIGDTYWNDPTSCFDGYGTSYILQWRLSAYRVGRVTGPGGTIPPLRKSAVKNPSLKILGGDWNWHPNRHLDQPRTVWHRMSSTDRQMCMLFADGHVEYFRFPTGYSDLPGLNQPIDPGYGFY